MADPSGLDLALGFIGGGVFVALVFGGPPLAFALADLLSAKATEIKARASASTRRKHEV